jgi:hypothetical protein
VHKSFADWDIGRISFCYVNYNILLHCERVIICLKQCVTSCSLRNIKEISHYITNSESIQLKTNQLQSVNGLNKFYVFDMKILCVLVLSLTTCCVTCSEFCENDKDCDWQVQSGFDVLDYTSLKQHVCPDSPACSDIGNITGRMLSIYFI